MRVSSFQERNKSEKKAEKNLTLFVLSMVLFPYESVSKQEEV